jgi:hypothetical protein
MAETTDNERDDNYKKNWIRKRNEIIIIDNWTEKKRKYEKEWRTQTKENVTNRQTKGRTIQKK